MWALGASLFSHAATFLSVSYFDQPVVFLYLTLAGICSGSAQARASSLQQDRLVVHARRSVYQQAVNRSAGIRARSSRPHELTGFR